MGGGGRSRPMRFSACWITTGPQIGNFQRHPHRMAICDGGVVRLRDLPSEVREECGLRRRECTAPASEARGCSACRRGQPLSPIEAAGAAGFWSINPRHGGQYGPCSQSASGSSRSTHVPALQRLRHYASGISRTVLSNPRLT